MQLVLLPPPHPPPPSTLFKEGKLKSHTIPMKTPWRLFLKMLLLGLLSSSFLRRLIHTRAKRKVYSLTFFFSSSKPFPLPLFSQDLPSDTLPSELLSTRMHTEPETGNVQGPNKSLSFFSSNELLFNFIQLNLWSALRHKVAGKDWSSSISSVTIPWWLTQLLLHTIHSLLVRLLLFFVGSGLFGSFSTP